MKLLELAGIGMECLAITVGAWYAGAKYGSRIREMADRNLAMGSESVVGLGALIPGETDDDDETEAEGLLAAKASSLRDPYTDMVVGWGELIWDKLRFPRWARITLFIPAGLALFALLVPWCALRLPFLIVGYLLGRDNDFRLRIAVLAFALGLCLQVVEALTS